MEPSWERPGSLIFRHVFVGSLALAGSCLLLIAASVVPPLSRAPEWLGYVTWHAAAVTIYGLISRIIKTTFLQAPPGVTTGEGLRSVILWGIVVYLGLLLMIGGLAYAAVPRDDHHWPLIVMGLALWGPVLLAGPPAAFIAWSRFKHRASESPN